MDSWEGCPVQPLLSTCTVSTSGIGASQPTAATATTTAMATLWNFQFSANVQVVTEVQKPWLDIMAEEL